MSVLHIEHRISDFEIWKGAFDAFATRRRMAGVSHERVCRPVEDPHYVVIDLDFTAAEQAYAFLDFLAKSVVLVRERPCSGRATTGQVLDVASKRQRLRLYSGAPDRRMRKGH